MTQIKYWLLISTLSFAFPNDGEGYRFIGNSTQDYYIDLDSIFEMSFGPWDVLNNFSGRQAYEFMAPKEKQDEIIYKMTWSKVIATTRIGDKVSPNHEAQKQNGTSYTAKNDPITGKLISIVGNDEASMQMMEMVTNDEVGSLFTSDENNLLYPFGSDSIRYVGDVWTIEKEEEKSGNVFAFEEFEGTFTDEELVKVLYLSGEFGLSMKEILERDLDDVYLFEGSPKDYAEQYLEDSGILDAVEKAGLSPFYIDTDAYARDMEINGGFTTFEHHGNQFVIEYHG